MNKIIYFAAFLFQLQSEEIRQFYTTERLASSTSYETLLIDHAYDSYEKALAGRSSLNLKTLDFNPLPIHHLLNNLCAFNSMSYIQSGLNKGELFISALLGNTGRLVHKIGIFFYDVERQHPLLGARCQYYFNWNEYSLITTFKKIPFVNIFDICFYDPTQSLNLVKQSFIDLDPSLSSTFILVVDDWGWDCVRKEVFEAFDLLGYSFYKEWEIPPAPNFGNGQYIAVIQKPLNEKEL